MEKINIAELLKNCPSGMELDCALFDNVILSRIDLDFECDYPIRIETKGGCLMDLTKYGTYTNEEEAKCLIFPKGKNTWEGFVPPYQFKDGDIISNGTFIAIFCKTDRPDTSFTRDVLYYRCWYNCRYNTFKAKIDFGIGSIDNYRLATEKEKQRLFDAIAENDYHWDAKTKTLERLLKFKVGDRVKKKDSNEDIVLITDIADNYYIVETKYGMEVTISISIQDEYELVPNKFNINTLKPFKSEVLIRTENSDIWEGDIFVRYDKNATINKFHCIGGWYEKCIPFEGNEWLLGTTNDCNNYYKTWEK